MALCDFISETATQLARERAPLSGRDAYLLFVLQGMPHFKNVRRLDLWESAYQEVAHQADPSKNQHLLDELFELGCYNLYTAFSPDGTLQRYERLREKLLLRGTACRSPPISRNGKVS